jgi:hypothetical protein
MVFLDIKNDHANGFCGNADQFGDEGMSAFATGFGQIDPLLAAPGQMGRRPSQDRRNGGNLGPIDVSGPGFPPV